MTARYKNGKVEVTWSITHGENTDDRDLFELVDDKGLVVGSAKTARQLRRLVDWALETGATHVKHTYDLKLSDK